jgi:hypothetical protein
MTRLNREPSEKRKQCRFGTHRSLSAGTKHRCGILRHRSIIERVPRLKAQSALDILNLATWVIAAR